MTASLRERVRARRLLQKKSKPPEAVGTGLK